ncbi:hypothetical protein CRUP_005524, partial [Coryphaenoides rupestris]
MAAPPSSSSSVVDVVSAASFSSFSELLDHKTWRPDSLDVLQSFSCRLRDTEYREQLETSGEEEEEEEEGSSGGELTLQLIAECFRAQRNACVQSPRNQALLRELSFIEDSLKVIGVLHRMHLQNRDATLEPLRCGVQFLGNMAVGNQLCKDNIWNLSFPHLM